MSTLSALLLVLAMAPPIPVVKGTNARPETAAAQVLLLAGAPTLGEGASEVKLVSGMLLEAKDQVRVPAGAWLTLYLLGNARVVRLDDDLVLRVDELAVFKAPPVGTDLEQQLNQLLTTSERTANEARLTGWKAGLSAAKTTQQTKPGAMEPQRNTLGLGQKRTGREEVLAPSPAPPPPPPPAPAPPPPPVPPAEPQALREPPKSPELGKRGASEQEASAAPPARRRGLAWDAGLQRCLADEYRAAGLLEANATVKVELRLVDGEVVVRLPRGFPPSPCVRAWAAAQQAQLSTQWTALTVPLP